ncbi:MAG: hypothetical protein HKN09_07855 [Saprospiraceae bacterium]|nr:hypothetical protein [Saprospiraceae bacterium]
MWHGIEVLDTSFVEFATSPAPACTDGIYGGHIWLNRGNNVFPDAPEDLFFFSGFQGQYVCGIPSKQLIVVRLGVQGDDPFVMNEVLKFICESVPTI